MLSRCTPCGRVPTSPTNRSAQQCFPRCASCLYMSRRLPVLSRARTGEDEEQPDLLLSPAECPVPREQLPTQELKNLQEALFFDWAQLPLPEFALRLSMVFAGFFFTMGLPVSALTFNASHEPLQLVASASAGSMFIVLVLVLRLYLGWQYIGSRLLSATVEYEETGWYDGQLWVKSPQVLMRDRLLGTYKVKPAVQRLKNTLVSLSGALVASFIVLSAVPPDKGSSASLAAERGAQLMSVASSGSSPAASSAGQSYWQRVQQYEPWALDEDSTARSNQ